MTTPPSEPTGAAYPESSQAVVAVILSGVSVLGLCCFFFGILAIPGVILGYLELKGINEGRRDPGQRSMAIAAIVIGGVVLVLTAASFAFGIAARLGEGLFDLS